MGYRRLLPTIFALIAVFAISLGVGPVTYAWPGSGVGNPVLSCAAANAKCFETGFQKRIWGDEYVGHDEPGVAFLSKQSGAGNRYQTEFVLPKDPPPTRAAGRSYTFETGGVFWFGMILCDSQGYPLATKRCTPDSDSNIQPLAKHPGSAYMEMQFYAPGWVNWPPGDGCDATKWCAALNVDSLSFNPLNNTTLNQSCSNAIGGNEYVNFAFITKNGKAQAPANPIQATQATYTPDPTRDLYMNSGDRIALTMKDTSGGLRIVVRDLTTGGSGSMTAGKANKFAQVDFRPHGVACTPRPYNFHPMYSTASSGSILPWGATQDDIEFVDEIGHFDWCQHSQSGTAIQPTGDCPDDAFEGINATSASDYDDTYCFPASASTLVRVGGCLGGNVPGYDGASYIADWPDGNTKLHPQSVLFVSPKTGSRFSSNYRNAAIQTDLPAIEPAVQCDINTGKGCGLLPWTDWGQPAAFYPFFSIGKVNGACNWAIGNAISGFTTNDFGRNAQYGKLMGYEFLTPGKHGATNIQYTGFRHVLSNPCPAR